MIMPATVGVALIKVIELRLVAPRAEEIFFRDRLGTAMRRSGHG
ncbi:MAG: hypothetical protein JWQ55_5915, partial [Rhodopila sp.]|nr:hypothetical protein [Rhodopila sp.]